jgi:hypothetical protein
MLEKSRAVRFVTLTMAPVAKDLGECVDALHRAFRKLRKSDAWKQCVRGGCFVIEVTRGASNTHWHVHAHVLVDGEYFPHAMLHDAWSVAVGKASRVEIKALHDREGAVAYLTKYLAKGTAPNSWTHAEICEFALQMKGRRVVGTFGTWHKTKTDGLDDEVPAPAKPDVDLSFVAVEAVMDAEPELRRDAAPLLSRLSATWRLLMKPYVSDVHWLDAPLDAKAFASLTTLLLEIQESLTFRPMKADEIRREVERLRKRRRDAERDWRPLDDYYRDKRSGCDANKAGSVEAEARSNVGGIQRDASGSQAPT